MRRLPLLSLFLILVLCKCSESHEVSIVGELKKWHATTLTFQGPETHENDTPNPFTDYRLIVEFTNEDHSYSIPGFYVADGNAAESGAKEGNKWQVRFIPDKTGTWHYTASFRQGKNIAVSDNPEEGEPVFFDGARGTFQIAPSDKNEKDFRSKGKLKYVGTRYLQFAETGEYYLKGGADSPENFLAYEDFDDTFYNGDQEQRMGEAAPNESLHAYKPHLKDWKEGDPTWQNGKGKSIIGALNYLASKDMNSVYFLTLNIQGDGEDVWPYNSYETRTRFDCSKLDQWEIVFSHMDQLGLMLHIVLQETENETMLNGGDMGFERKLYFRELIARFAHHLAITWNMGEENGYADFTPVAQNRKQQKAMVKYIKEHDPYQNFTVIHTHANVKYRDSIFNELLGYPYLDGPSMQLGNPLNTHHATLSWLKKSKANGKQWVVNIDEIGPHWRGVDPDDRADLNNQDSVRKYVLWANLMAGGSGVEWYFGYKNHNNDLGCEDWRSRDRMWDYTRYALQFFQKHLPFHEMEPADSLTINQNDFCFVKENELITIYLPKWSQTQIDMNEFIGEFEVKWYDPKNGGELQNGSITTISGGEKIDVSDPPGNPDQDWIVLIRKTE